MNNVLVEVDKNKVIVTNCCTFKISGEENKGSSKKFLHKIVK